MYNSEKELVTVKANAVYLEEQSEPYDNFYIWLYSAKVKNNGLNCAQLVRRLWKITDENGYSGKIEDPGYSENFPLLKAGESFEYTSALLLSSPSAIVEGYHEFLDEDNGSILTVAVDVFSLDSPYSKGRSI